MERMQASGDQATTAAAAASAPGGGGGAPDDFMAELLKQMQAGEGASADGGGDGGANEEELSKMLLGMMEQLTNKEILYEPMKELDDKFPAWLTANRATASSEELRRYEGQRDIVREIVAKFEEPGYSDDKATDREYVVERMQQVCGNRT
jgi:peroxin-19